MRRERHGSRACAVGGAFDISAPRAVAAHTIEGPAIPRWTMVPLL